MPRKRRKKGASSLLKFHKLKSGRKEGWRQWCAFWSGIQCWGSRGSCFISNSYFAFQQWTSPEAACERQTWRHTQHPRKWKGTSTYGRTSSKILFFKCFHLYGTSARKININTYGIRYLWKTIQKVYWSEVYCSEGYLGWWSEVKVLLKLVCCTCRVTILETRYSTFSPLCCVSYVHCC